MGVEISLDPPVCPIQANGGVSKHKMINHCDKILAFKVKSSNNSNYSVNLIYGILKVCDVKELVITRKPGKPQADKLIIQYCMVEDENADPKPLFANGVPPGELSGETVIKLSAAE
ncbi:motile sperm domain-containing protein [Caenorhabditis elegans]|uniref:Uncharacterized protein ZK1307.3 n=1 Tax=Caenorhabditis elegans TaxID=6239 RepID=YS13_CAEEL|nr:Uncharacterized protein CELE_ZK1307.3 [Caenorhabditis elegans]Q09361.1 RecName: Full=Uncharacterized protein ZK1307.3 [Caenorhabditis elegans]CAA87431.1 Uncharacterized protein CELE_ZK1307.3 [Caenorhabditis elegans]|eukprot:NP_496079.1 Uncharacterized protein CELE_ZK1307.3 [Caenorhabditis elegans]